MPDPNPILLLSVPPIGARLQREVARKGPLTKVVCADRGLPYGAQVTLLAEWARANGVPEDWMDTGRGGTPHFDLWGRPGKRVRG